MVDGRGGTYRRTGEPIRSVSARQGAASRGGHTGAELQSAPSAPPAGPPRLAVRALGEYIPGGRVDGHAPCPPRHARTAAAPARPRPAPRRCRTRSRHTRGGGAGLRLGRRAPAATAPHHHTRGLQVVAGRLPADPGGPLDPPQRPPEASQGQDLMSFVFSQDVAHAAQEHAVSGRRQRLGPLSEMTGFQPSTNGRFWVSTEE